MNVMNVISDVRPSAFTWLPAGTVALPWDKHAPTLDLRGLPNHDRWCSRSLYVASALGPSRDDLPELWEVQADIVPREIGDLYINQDSMIYTRDRTSTIRRVEPIPMTGKYLFQVAMALLYSRADWWPKIYPNVQAILDGSVARDYEEVARIRDALAGQEHLVRMLRGALAGLDEPGQYSTEDSMMRWRAITVFRSLERTRVGLTWQDLDRRLKADMTF